MKLGATTTSQGVTCRWESVRSWHGTVSVLTDGIDGLGCVSRNSRLMRNPGLLWIAYVEGLGEIGAYRHRWQAKRAVETAASQALREAE